MRETSLAALLLVGVAACGSNPPAAIPPGSASASPSAFQPAATASEVRRQHRRLPQDDIWWTVNGPDMAWNFKNLHQLFPTVNVYRSGPVRALRTRPMPEIDDFPVSTPQGEMRFADFIESGLSTCMGVIVLHRGEIVFERYPRMREYEMPVYWSVAKVFVGTLLRLLEERGEVDVAQSIDHYLPELSASSLAGTPVRHLLDMASGLDCADDYEDRTSCYYRYSMAIGDGHRSADAPDDPYEFVANLQATRHAPSGQVFSYSGMNTFVLAWLVEELSGMPFQDAFSREIWYHIGAEADASYIAPRYGIALTHGGFLARLRDVARFGLLFTPSYAVVSDRRIVSAAHLELLRHGGDPALMSNAGIPGLETTGIRHNVYQWDAIFANDTFLKGGWAGQGLIVNPSWDVVAVHTGYFKDDAHSEVALQPVLLEVLNGVFGGISRN